MLESKAVILPVFYDVEPLELQWIKRGAYAEAFNRHTKRQRVNFQTLEKWKAVSLLSGMEFWTFNDNYGVFLTSILNSVLRIMSRRKTLQVANYPSGLDEDFKSKIFDGCGQQRENVKTVRIVGMGDPGEGTSQLNELQTQYILLQTASRKGLHSLQNMLFEDLSRYDLYRMDEKSGGIKCSSMSNSRSEVHNGE